MRKLTNILLEAATECPVATLDLELNTKNRDASIKADHIKYGPLNVDEPGDYWKDLAEYWDTTEEAAKKSLCGNCVAFDISPRMKECMPGETSDEDIIVWGQYDGTGSELTVDLGFAPQYLMVKRYDTNIQKLSINMVKTRQLTTVDKTEE